MERSQVRWRDLGPARSLDKAPQFLTDELLRVGRRQMVSYCSEYNWVSRVEAFDLAMQRRKEMALESAIEELARQQAEAGAKLREKGLERINQLKAKDLTPAEARIYVTDGTQLERVAHGLTDDRKSREPRTIKVIISAPRLGRTLSTAVERPQLEAGESAQGSAPRGVIYCEN